MNVIGFLDRNSFIHLSWFTVNYRQADRIWPAEATYILGRFLFYLYTASAVWVPGFHAASKTED